MLFIVRALSKTWQCWLSGGMEQRGWSPPVSSQPRAQGEDCTPPPVKSKTQSRTGKGKLSALICGTPEVLIKVQKLSDPIRVTKIKRSNDKSELQLRLIKVAPFIPEGNIWGSLKFYFLRGGACFGKVIAMKEYEMSKYSHAAWRNHQEHSGAIPIHLPCNRVFPSISSPLFLPQTLQRHRGECNKMRPIHPQSCVCTLRGSTVIHTSTEEWQLPRPQILSVRL